MVIEAKGGSVTLGSLLLDGGRVATGSKSAVGQGAAYGVGGFLGGPLMGAIAGSMVSVPKWSAARAPGPSMTPFDVNLVRGDVVRLAPVLDPTRLGILARVAW